MEEVLEVFEPWTDPWHPPDPPPEQPHSSGTPAAFLRDHAIPEIEDVARRVQTKGHQLTVQDLLDLPDATLRILFWPRPGRMAASADRTRITLEFTVQRDGAEEAEEVVEVVAVCWSGDTSSERVSLGHVSGAALDLDWVRGRVLDFIEIALAEA